MSKEVMIVTGAGQISMAAAVHKAVPVCTDPAAQFPDSCRQHRIIARICSKIDRDVHGISPFVFFHFTTQRAD